MKYILRESNDINRYIKYILEEDTKDEAPRGNSNLPDFKTADDVLKSYSKDKESVKTKLAELDSLSSKTNDIIKQITDEIDTVKAEDATSVDETEKSNAIKDGLRKLNNIFKTNDIFNKYLKGDRVDNTWNLVKDVFDLAQKDTGKLTQAEINEAEKLFDSLNKLRTDADKAEEIANSFEKMKDEDRKRLRDEINYLVKNHEEVEKRLFNAQEKYNDLSDDNKNEIKKYVETIAGSPKCEDIASENYKEVINLKVTCDVVIGRLVIDDNNKESDENLSWEEKFKRLNTHDKEANDKFWLEFINYTFYDNNNINEAAELRKALGESFEIQVRNYGMTEGTNVFIRFVKDLRSKNIKIEHDGYSAIHNEFADRRLSVNDLLSKGSFEERNIIFCKDFYEKSFLDCVGFLECQYKINHEKSLDEVNEEYKQTILTWKQAIDAIMYTAENKDKLVNSVSIANENRIKVFGFDEEESTKKAIDNKEIDAILQKLFNVFNITNDKVGRSNLAQKLCKVYYNSFDEASVNKVSSLMKKIDENVNLDNLTTTKKEQRELTSKFDEALSNKKMNTNDLVKLLTALAPEKNKDNQ